MLRKFSTLRARLGAVLVFAAALLVAVGCMGIWGMRQSHHGLETVYKQHAIGLNHLATVERLTLRSQALVMRSVLNPDTNQIRADMDDLNTNLTQSTKAWNDFMATQLSSEERVLALQWVSDYRSFVQDGLKLAETALREGRIQDAITTTSFEIQSLYRPVAEGLDTLIALQTEESKREYARSDALNLTLLSAAVAAIALGVLVFVIVGVLLTRSIVRPIRDAVRIADQIALGHLDSRIDSERTDEIGELLAALKTMSGGLRNIVRDVRDAAGAVARSSSEIARGNSDLSARTEEQASTLEETAASMEELSTTVKQNTDNAGAAKKLAAGASDIAGQGGQLMGEVVGKMSGISESSKKIADIVGLIDGIAFQTNILALNAAVEAARAGEQGRGFAVVASEVRSLAQRSAAAAKEIKTLIADSVQRVADGTKLVETTGDTMAEIVKAVNRVTEMVSDIATASHEQLTGIEQVRRAVVQMDEVVQQNAAVVEESAAAAENQSGQAEMLVKTVARFTLGDETAASNDSVTDVAPRAAESAATASVIPLRVAEPPSAQRTPALRIDMPVRSATRKRVGAAPDKNLSIDWKEF